MTAAQPASLNPAAVNAAETVRLDKYLSALVDDDTRESMWQVASEILSCAEAPTAQAVTGLALGYVQSGKTTAMTALMAAAADRGYRLIIAFLGSTNLLLNQNASRIEGAIGIDSRSDYKWVSLTNPSGVQGSRELRDWLGKGRVVLVCMIKHAGRIDGLARAVSGAVDPNTRVLIVDDEADQASLNTRVNSDEESSTYAAIRRLRANLPPHLYIQYTATPYAPLLLEPEDHLLPTFVAFLQPGRGYTGGREFFVDHEKQVIRPIPTLDEQAPKRLPTELPRSLVAALANYIMGTAILLERKSASPPMSMLIHSTQRNDVQARYFFLLERVLKTWRQLGDKAKMLADLPPAFAEEWTRLVTVGASRVDETRLLTRVQYVLREIKPWLVNSQSAVAKVNWNAAPCHIVMGGNKLDRGFTVEGLTVTYMNRPTTNQIDTLEQRARAFGYRSDLLPYCQFFATPRTLKVLRDIVFTEYDLRARLQDWLAAGGTVQSWAHQVGLMVPDGSRPTRENVLRALNTFNSTSHWHSLRRPSLDPENRRHNLSLVSEIGLLGARYENYGRLSHRTLRIDLGTFVELVLKRWRFESYSPDWRHEEIVKFLERLSAGSIEVPVMLLEREDGTSRIRDWDEQTGFVNLFQGPDPSPPATGARYPGDRYVLGLEDDPSQVVFQIHHVRPRSVPDVSDLYTLTAHLGDKASVTRGEPHGG